VKAAGTGGTKSTSAGAAKVQELPSPGKRVLDFNTNISVDVYLVGKFFLTGDTLQDRARGTLLLFRLWWRPQCLLRCLGRRVARSALVVRFRRSLPSRTKWALCPAS
jgi:hypothetical protein